MRNTFRIGFGYMKMKGIGNGGGGQIILGGRNLAKSAITYGISMKRRSICCKKDGYT